MIIRLRNDHSLALFFKRTIAAQMHLLGGLLMCLGGVFLLPPAQAAGPSHFWACLSFLVTGICVFMGSTLYHFLSDGFDISPRFRTFLRNVDHFGIYLFIAGTYTPFVMSAISESWRAPLIIIIWTIAVVGIAYTWFKPVLPPILRSRAIYTGLFVLMGWTIIIRITEVFQLPWWRLFLLSAGGAAYTVGAIVYAMEKPRLYEGIFGHHELWHLLVMIGAAMHYFMILSFYYPVKG